MDRANGMQDGGERGRYTTGSCRKSYTVAAFPRRQFMKRADPRMGIHNANIIRDF
jgi:hypothetical protein